MPRTGLALIQASESSDDGALVSNWFDSQWQALAQAQDGKPALVAALRELSAVRSPASIYALILHHLFSGGAEALDEDRAVNAATGIRETVVWNKLFRFQRVVGALDKLNRYGGCIIADSVGLGKTFEALAIIKYFELRNDRVLVLCPKRLRDNGGFTTRTIP